MCPSLGSIFDWQEQISAVDVDAAKLDILLEV
jgi:hypothetical protein